ncbi:hypothetical protein BBI09_08770 [Stutzerimonas xanthomarina]|uniref:hypothetical protein n=1 Tax=Stutzerimonas nitrititolerans TaxID=2482751 RepID=UPI000825283D|nr:hypothetical protein [Stutzerimonas stutzeri]OCX19127.1 hypothetical protein BBI09_08770 [Stutzerimonas xanthomarina]HBB78066.1 hypothetical protein [Pseudomonas sp.]HCL74906.1 hypothetical protein [Pseudomonas sp.]
MDNHLLLAFISAAFLLTVTPGVDTAIVLRAATVDGRRQALMASLGIALGRFLRQPSAVKVLDRLTGGIFVAFGIRLAASPAP